MKVIFIVMSLAFAIASLEGSVVETRAESDVKNEGRECFRKCNTYEKKQGKCPEFCGVGGLCCRKKGKKRNYIENGCDGLIGGQGQHECVKNPLGPLIMIATGYAPESAQYFETDIQVVDVNSTSLCSNRQPYPFALDFATGGLLNGKPLICGVRDSWKDSSQSTCYSYEKSKNEWNLHANMNSKRLNPSSASIDGAIWVTGGFDSEYNALDSTEYIHNNGSVINGPNMPAGRSRHCMVTLHDGKVMIIGGEGNYWEANMLQNVLIFNPKDKTFNPGPSRSLPYRASHGCTIFRSRKHDNRPVVLAAGGEFVTAEILDYTNADAAWEEIGSLPEDYTGIYSYGARALPSLSGYGAYVQHAQYWYELTCTSVSCDWSIMDLQLTESRTDTVMMYLPYDYTC